MSNARELKKQEGHRKLLALLSGVRVRQVRAGKIGRVRTVRKIVANAGSFRFYQEDGTEMTVRVSLDPDLSDLSSVY